jgi:CheY-like chemotaxis protein
MQAWLLIVDDDQDSLEAFSVILGEKYHVSSYRCAAEALAALREVEPDLLVLDIRMKPVDGVHCLEAIRARPGYGRIPAIALTAFARDVERNAFLAAGFQAVVTKPVVDYGELLAVVASLLTPVAAPGHERPGAGPSCDRSHRAVRVLTASTSDGIMTRYGFGTPAPEPA